MIKEDDLRSSKLRAILEVLLVAEGEALTVPQIQRRLSQALSFCDLTQEEIEAHLRWSHTQPNADDYYHVHAVSAQRLTQRPGTWTIAPK